MSRATKKFVYGIFYLLILVLLGMAIFGGSAESPAEKNFVTSLLRIATAPEIFSLSDGRSIILAKVFNPNNGYGAPEFSYVFKIYSSAGRKLREEAGKDFIYASETKYIFEPLRSGIAGIGRIELDFPQIKWEPIEKFSKPATEIVNATTTASAAGIEISGAVVNNSPLEIREAKILAVIFDNFGFRLFGFQTVITSLTVGSRRPFSILIPADPLFLDKIDTSKTEILVSPR